MDAFSGSLLHVNKIYNRAFGYKARKVPSHMPHMVDVDVMKELQAKFVKEFDATSSNKLRSKNDMQFALSYFYYVIDQTKEFDVSRVFQEVDADKSGRLILKATCSNEANMLVQHHPTLLVQHVGLV